MDFTGFLNSYGGMYLVQSVYHALIAAVITDAGLKAWRVENPVTRQQFRLMVILLALCLFPLYQMMNPDRGSLSFRLEALFDSSRWMYLELGGGITGGMVFFGIMLFTALVFVFQEGIPVLRHALASAAAPASGVRPPHDSPVARALQSLPGNRPEVFLVEDDAFLLFSVTGKRPAVYLSTGFVRELTPEELRAAIAHEIGHIERSRKPILVAVFLLRMALFFNPVALMEFRRIVHEEEDICDDAAVALTGNPRALADVLRKFSGQGDDPAPGSLEQGGRLHERIEEYSYRMLMESRIARLSHREDRRTAGVWFVFLLTFTMIILINYFVV